MSFLRTGRVVSSEGGLYAVDVGNGERRTCKPRGKFRYDKIRLLVGDLVKVEEDEKGNLSVKEIFERKNFLIRPALANVDFLFIAASAASPEPVLENMDKLTAIAEHAGILPVIVVTKSDLSPQSAHDLQMIYEKVGYKVFVISSVLGENLEGLRDYMKERCADGISVFTGASGVGKSTLLNALFPKLSRKTGAVSERLGRGKHTTRTVDLFGCGALLGKGTGYIADTPGFSLLDFENFDFFDLEDLPYNFREFRECLGKCRYTGCTHCRDEGCAVIEKVRSGDIPVSRHKSYVLLHEQLKNKHPWDRT